MAERGWGLFVMSTKSDEFTCRKVVENQTQNVPGCKRGFKPLLRNLEKENVPASQ